MSHQRKLAVAPLLLASLLYETKVCYGNGKCLCVLGERARGSNFAGEVAGGTRMCCFSERKEEGEEDEGRGGERTLDETVSVTGMRDRMFR